MKVDKDKHGGGASGAPKMTAADVDSGPTVTAKTPITDIRTILSVTQLQALRDGFDEAVFHRFAPLQTPYPKAHEWVTFVGNTIYNRQTDEAGHEVTDPNIVRSTAGLPLREPVVLAVMATTQRDPSAMAGHIYWALSKMEVEEVADVFLTVGTYAGLDNLRFTLGVLKDVLTLLSDLSGPDQMKTSYVLPYLKGAYTSDLGGNARAFMAALAAAQKAAAGNA